MRTESPPTVTPPVRRILSRLATARRSVWARGPLVRWLAVVGAAAVIGGLSYVAAIPSPGKYLGEGREYSGDAIERIKQALDVARLEYRVENRRVGVAASRYDEAMALVSKLDLNPRSIPEIRKAAQVGGLWDTTRDKEQRELRAKCEILEAIISRFEGVVSAVVEIYRTPSTGGGGRPTTTTTAFVLLETKDGHEIGPKTVQSIKDVVVNNEPALKADAVGVMDRKGRKYLDPSDPALDVLSRTRAREEELAQEIQEHLDWIDGAQVNVQLVAPPEPEPDSIAAPVIPPPQLAVAEPRVAVNQPLDPGPEELAEVSVPPPAAASEPTAVNDPKPAPKADFARVWVTIPRSFYHRKALPNRNPSRDDYQAIQARTETFVKRAVGFVLPAGTFELTFDTILDDVVIRDPSVAPAVPESRRLPSWWLPASVGAGAAVWLLIVGLRRLATRRPRRTTAAEPARLRFELEAEPESGPGASERVRELIRHNPEAAAGVLQRWIGHGGHAA